MKMSKHRGGLGKFILGAGIGIGIGMLFSKRSGEENRKLLKQKANELIEKIKTLDSKEVKENIQAKVDEILVEISELDKEKVLKIAKKKANDIKTKAGELVNYVVEKGTPVLEKTANVLRENAISVTKQILNKLEQEEK